MSLVRLSQSNVGVGDVVMLLPDIYEPRLANPAMGSEWECLGTIKHIHVTNFRIDYIDVEWENGSINGYRPADLLKMTDVEEGSYVDVWTKIG
jgi:hypothetical protein